MHTNKINASPNQIKFLWQMPVNCDVPREIYRGHKVMTWRRKAKRNYKGSDTRRGRGRGRGGAEADVGRGSSPDGGAESDTPSCWPPWQSSSRLHPVSIQSPFGLSRHVPSKQSDFRLVNRLLNHESLQNASRFKLEVCRIGS